MMAKNKIVYKQINRGYILSRKNLNIHFICALYLIKNTNRCMFLLCACVYLFGKSFYNVKQLTTPYENFKMCFHHICMNCTQFIFCITLNIFKKINSTWLIRNSLQGFCFMHVTFYLEIMKLLKATT